MIYESRGLASRKKHKFNDIEFTANFKSLDAFAFFGVIIEEDEVDNSIETFLLDLNMNLNVIAVNMVIKINGNNTEKKMSSQIRNSSFDET